MKLQVKAVARRLAVIVLLSALLLGALSSCDWRFWESKVPSQDVPFPLPQDGEFANEPQDDTTKRY